MFNLWVGVARVGMSSWIFLLLFTMPSFGGPVTVTFEFTTQDGCRGLQKVVTKELATYSMNKDELVECHETKAP